jgi:antibiotic biosynthesis monooxygenase (ABM) superfamily enzyme
VILGKSEGLRILTSAQRFCTVVDMQNWPDSSDRQDLVAKAEVMLADRDLAQASRHNEFWFAPMADVAQPPRWK